ncbi:MAG TPA: porin family protein [Allosphingosinicella sp.]|nr:porin family protein [Allosphingosinicella sp.]
MRKLALLALLAGSAATPAVAQEPAAHGGLRVEALVGYDNIGADGVTADGPVYGLGLGYDFQAGSLVAGLEAEASDSGADECSQSADPAARWRCVAGGRDLYAGGRIGVAVGTRALLYAKAGYANSRVTAVPVVTVPVFPPPDFRRELDGIRAGAGVEIGLTARLFVKTEYRYTNYEDGFDRHQLVGGIGLRF